MVDKYLEKFEEIKNNHKEYMEKRNIKLRYASFKKGYNIGLGKKDLLSYEPEFRRKGEKILVKENKEDSWHELDSHNKGIFLGVASKLMSVKNPIPALHGAKIYEGLGVGNRASVKRRLLRAYEKNPCYGYDKEIKAFLKRNPESKEGKTLEHKFIPVLAGASVIVALFFLSPNLTGNAVGNLVKSDSNIIGAVLFVLGIAGLFISFRKR